LALSAISSLLGGALIVDFFETIGVVTGVGVANFFAWGAGIIGDVGLMGDLTSISTYNRTY